MAMLMCMPEVSTASKPRNAELYPKWIRLQCCKDRFDTGAVYPHVSRCSVLLPAMGAFAKTFTDTNVTVKRIFASETEALSKVASIFRSRNLFSNAPMANIVHDMTNVFAIEPFYTFAAVRDGRVVGGAVACAHELNNGERLIHIELLASESGIACGVGTSIMRVLRSLSQVSAAHTGHMVAFTLKTKDARRFYARKLPEVGPSARAFLYSIHLLDPHSTMPPHLEMRSVAVPPKP